MNHIDNYNEFSKELDGNDYIAVVFDRKRNDFYWGGCFPESIEESKKMLRHVEIIRQDLKNHIKISEKGG